MRCVHGGMLRYGADVYARAISVPRLCVHLRCLSLPLPCGSGCLSKWRAVSHAAIDGHLLESDGRTQLAEVETRAS